MLMIEMMPSETREDMKAFLEALVGKIYRMRPEWLEYDLRESYRFGGREFIRMFCPDGSFHGQLSLRASTGDGTTRGILQLGTREGRPCAWLLHHGQESEHDPDKVERVGQQDRPRQPQLRLGVGDLISFIWKSF